MSKGNAQMSRKDHLFAGIAVGLILGVPTLAWAEPPNDLRRGGLPMCLEELAACQAQPGLSFPGDGYTGAPLSYEQPDPPDGTFTDLNTGLMWEIKLPEDDLACVSWEQIDRDVHCVQNGYTWTADPYPYPPTGTAFTEFLAGLNADDGFAGYTDWRLPTVKELQSLVDYSQLTPPVLKDEEGEMLLPGATASTYYWSSTPDASFGSYAWVVQFFYGHVYSNEKSLEHQVRAVRDVQ